jgi:hypothetical protein
MVAEPTPPKSHAFAHLPASIMFGHKKILSADVSVQNTHAMDAA